VAARGLRRRSAAASLMQLWVRIPPGTCMSVVSVVCCQVQRSPTECGVSGCDRESLIMRRPWPTGDCWAVVKKNCLNFIDNKFSSLHVC
jgi:hypothetical protein